MPTPADALDDLPMTFSRAGRGVLCFVVSLAPLLVWLFAFHHAGTVDHELASAGVMLVLGQVYMPAVLLAVTFGDSALNALWPPAWIHVISRAPASYVAFTGLWLVTIFIGGALVGVLQMAVGLVPVAGFALSATLAMLYWFTQAILVGLFIRKNAEAFGW